MKQRQQIGRGIICIIALSVVLSVGACVPVDVPKHATDDLVRFTLSYTPNNSVKATATLKNGTVVSQPILFEFSGTVGIDRSATEFYIKSELANMIFAGKMKVIMAKDGSFTFEPVVSK